MSYILDALVKADYERQRGSERSTVPGLHTVHAQLLSPPDTSAANRFRLAAGLGMAGLTLVAGWQFWLARQPPVERPAAPPVAPGVAAVPVSTNPSTAVVAPPAPPPAAKPVAAVALRPARPAAAPEVAAPERVARAAPASRSANPPPTHAVPATPPAADDVRPPARVLRFGELPSAIQKEIPKISISGFANTDAPEARMAIVNDRALREGDLLAGGLRVEAIAADGVVFGYKGYRFRLGPQ